ncbi:MAG TPA: glycosyltransferase N-terminal domain-containing protein [Acidobacteriaceae bacterium]|nr:glycosyltransferase N-terminal domain-containing protein [Acidobacteriaceae bacterium]
MIFAYSLLLGAGLAVSSPWWLLRLMTARRYREGLPERLGRVPERLREAAAGRRVVWLHAVSVGEVLAATQLVRELEAAFAAQLEGGPWRVVISTTTRTGQALARDRFGADRVFWFPVDFGWAVRSWLRVLRPRMVVLVESELWPRLLHECELRRIPVAVVNARMSDRSFRRARRFRRLWAQVLGRVPKFLAQSEETAARLRILGADPGAVSVTGNLKYDVEPPRSEMAEMLRILLHRRSPVVAGSLLAPEEQVLLNEWPEVQRRAPEALLVLAPRHPERFDQVAEQIRERFPLLRASELLLAHKSNAGVERLPPTAVVLLDTVGDLAAVYALADAAFVGGSLEPKGGHNPLEPARFGVPVVMGSSFANFREIVEEMQAVDGIQIVHGSRELANSLTRLLTDHVAADALGQRGRSVFEKKSGATGRTVKALLEQLRTAAHEVSAAGVEL